MRLELPAAAAASLLLPGAIQAPAVAPVRPQPGTKVNRPVRVLEGITFDVQPGDVYVPLRDLRETIGLPIRADGGRLYLAGKTLPRRIQRRLLDGTALVSIRGLKAAGVPVGWDRRRSAPVVSHKSRDFPIRAGVKRIVINRSEQRLRGWQGSRLVISSNVSTGRSGFTTPRGKFTAGPFKAVMHHSSIYNNAPMPFTVQVIGNVCIHGSASVPRAPASHGCIRMPLTGGNPARFVYEWVNRGAAVMIRDEWPASKA